MSVELAAVPFRARARLGGVDVADSRAALRRDEPGRPPSLWFPAADVAAPEIRWLAGVDELDGYLAAGDDRVDLELVDGVAGDDPRDVTVKAFPTWGDASDLIAVLDVEPLGQHRYRCAGRDDWRRPVVEGSQLLAQALVAIGSERPGQRVVSASMVFLRACSATAAYDLVLEVAAEGRTFNAYEVRVRQGGRLCATGTVLLDATAAAVIAHSVVPPEVPGPYDCPAYDMGVTGRDLRVVDGAYTGDPDAPVGPPELDVLVRFRSVPGDPAMHVGLLAQFTGHLSIAAALRPHAGVGQDQAHVTLSTAVNAISIAFHADVRADRWLLYRHRSVHAADGMTHAQNGVYDEAGRLLASFTVAAMVRDLPASVPGDARTAL